MPKPTITLHLINGEWIAEYRGGEEATIRRLFETNRMSTGFGVGADRDLIVRSFGRTNPGVKVVFNWRNSDES